jgi:hypothetical protein
MAKRKNIGPICKLPGFLQDVFFIFLLQLAAFSERFEPEGSDWTYFPPCFQALPFFLYSIRFDSNFCNRCPQKKAQTLDCMKFLGVK